MTISRRLALRYAFMAAVCLILVVWLGYHEFVVEPAAFAARGVSDLHKDTSAETATVCFLALIPVMLGVGWLWMRRVLAPLRALTQAVEKIHAENLSVSLPRTMNGDEVDKLIAVFNSMTVRLDESCKQIHEFTLHASHELKTPLTVVRAQLETELRDDALLSVVQREWICSLLDEVQRLAKIVDSLTLLTKADAGLIALERASVPLAELVREAAEDAVYLAQPHGIQVTLTACEEAVATGDRHRLRQLLLILTDNAVKYNRAGGTIDISLRRVGDTAELRISNTGDGVKPATLDHAFDRFARGENARGKVDGCGLGLTIAQWIVQAHGGTVQIISEPGEKTTALVRLPAFTVAPSPVQPTPVAA